MAKCSDQFNRAALLLIERGDAESIEQANTILESLTIHICVGENVQTNYSDQVALLTLVALGVRSFLGGVFVEGNHLLGINNRVRAIPGKTLERAIVHLGGVLGTPSTSKKVLVYLANATESSRGIRLVYSGWLGGIVPAHSESFDHPPNSPLTAVLAAALAIREVFEFLNGRCPEAGYRAELLSLWDLQSGSNYDISAHPKIHRLPSSIWIAGLGHLGQAFAWLIGMMNYSCPKDVKLVLQDIDWVGKSTFSTSVLSSYKNIGERKTRVVDRWLNNAGFDTRIIDQVFNENIVLESEDPRLCFVGVDNVQTRLSLSSTNFPLIIDAGLGRTADTFSRISVHVLPGEKSSNQIWGEQEYETSTKIDGRFSDLAKQQQLDECGQAELADIAVGAPFVGMVAASLVYSQALRLLHQGQRYDSIGLTVGDAQHSVTQKARVLHEVRNFSYQPAKD